MAAASVLSPSAASRSWNAVHRLVVLLFVVGLFAAAAFAIGRSSVDVHHGSSVIPPAPVSVSSPSGATAVGCRVGHPC